MENMLDHITKADVYKKFEVDDLLFVEFKCPYNDNKSRIWWHTNFFAFIVSGKTSLKTPGGNYVLNPGDCVFAKKGSVISTSEEHEDFCELLIFVPDQFIKTVVQKYRISFPANAKHSRRKPETVIPLTTDEVLRTYFQSLLNYFSLPDPPPEPLLKLKFEELIVHILYNHGETNLKSYFQELCATAKPSIGEIMEANFSSNLSLDEFARLCSRSLSSFKREFFSLYQTTPGKWLIEKRLEYSRYLLETTKLNIDEVCFESGFENRSHFIRIFKHRYGVTPGRYSTERTEPLAEKPLLNATV